MAWDKRTLRELATDQEVDVVVPAPGRKPIRATVWSVAVDGEVYLRSWKGDAGLWYRRALRTGRGAVVIAGSGRHEVRFVPVGDADLDAAIDREYLSKYRRSSYATAMTRPPATGTTLRLDSVTQDQAGEAKPGPVTQDGQPGMQDGEPGE